MATSVAQEGNVSVPSWQSSRPPEGLYPGLESAGDLVNLGVAEQEEAEGELLAELDAVHVADVDLVAGDIGLQPDLAEQAVHGEAGSHCHQVLLYLSG